MRECELTQAPEHDGLTTMQSWLRGRAASRLVANGRALESIVQAARPKGAPSSRPTPWSSLPTTRWRQGTCRRCER